MVAKGSDLVLRGERAFGDQGAADAPGDRGADGGVFEIDFGAPHRGLLRHHVGLGLTLGGQREIVLRLRRRLAVEQRLEAILLARGLKQGRFGLGQRRAGAVEVDLELGGVDSVEHRALFDDAALFERALQHDAGHARTDFGDAHRRDAAGRVLRHQDFLALDRDDADEGRGVPIGFVRARKTGRQRRRDRQSHPKTSTVCFRQHVIQRRSSIFPSSRGAEMGGDSDFWMRVRWKTCRFPVSHPDWRRAWPWSSRTARHERCCVKGRSMRCFGRNGRARR